jgi:UDP-N-acetylglucosamine 2-epimerase
LAGALTAAKLHIPVAHIEAGARSYDMKMPEEINRRLTDHCSTLLFTPTDNCTKNLLKEGISKAKIRQTAWKALASATTMTIAVIATQKIIYHKLFLPLYIAIGAAVYVATTRALKTLNKEDAQLVKEIFSEKTAKLNENPMYMKR